MAVDWEHLLGEANLWPDSGVYNPPDGYTGVSGSGITTYAHCGGEGHSYDIAHPEWYIECTGSQTITVTFLIVNADDSGAYYIDNSPNSGIHHVLQNIETGLAWGSGMWYYYYNRDTQWGEIGFQANYLFGSTYQIYEDISFVTLTYNNATGQVSGTHWDGTATRSGGPYTIGTPGGTNKISFAILCQDKYEFNIQMAITNLHIVSDGVMKTDRWNAALVAAFEPMEMIHPWDGMNGQVVYQDPNLGYIEYFNRYFDVTNYQSGTDGDGYFYVKNIPNEHLKAVYKSIFRGDFRVGPFRWSYLTNYPSYIRLWTENGGEWLIWGDYDSGRTPTKHQMYLTEPDGTVTTIFGSDAGPHTYYEFKREDGLFSLYGHGSLTTGVTQTHFEDVVMEGVEFKWELGTGPTASTVYQYFYPYLLWCKWWPRENEGPYLQLVSWELMDMAMEQLVSKKYMMFFEKLINSLDAYDIDTVRGSKYIDIDGFGSCVDVGSVAFVLDRFHRGYLYILRMDDQIADNPPDIITLSRSPDGHYWELLSICQHDDAVPRMWSEQCMDHVTDLVPGLCQFEAGGDENKYMCQVVHNKIVNPIYLRAFKVPGENQVRVEITPGYEPMTAYNVKVNLLMVP